MSLPTIFQLYCDITFFGGVPRVTTNLPQVTDKLYHNISTWMDRLKQCRKYNLFMRFWIPSKIFVHLANLYSVNYTVFLALNRVKVMVFNATFNNITVISWWSVSLVKETGVPGENHRPAASHWQTFSHNVVSSTPGHEWDSNWQL